MIEINAKSDEAFSVAEMVPWPWESSGYANPRRNDHAVDGLADLIERVGWGAPVLLQASTNGIIGGHTRWKACKLKGWKTAPARILDVSDRQAVMMALADNRMAEKAQWDPMALAGHLENFDLPEVELMGWDEFDLEALGNQVVDFGPLEGESSKKISKCKDCGSTRIERIEDEGKG